MSTPTVADKKPEMFCFQCEQTEHGTGCTTVGVCGKTPAVAKLQDGAVEMLKGLSQVAQKAAALGISDRQVDRFMLRTMFATLTNVSFGVYIFFLALYHGCLVIDVSGTHSLPKHDVCR